MVTISAYNAGQRFCILDIDSDGQVKEFREKTREIGNLVNIRLMVCQPEFIDLIDDDQTVLCEKLLGMPAQMGEFVAYKPEGFWQCVDTAREKEQLEAIRCGPGNSVWKVWHVVLDVYLLCVDDLKDFGEPIGAVGPMVRCGASSIRFASPHTQPISLRA